MSDYRKSLPVLAGLSLPECPDINDRLKYIGAFRRGWYSLLEKCGRDTSSLKSNYYSKKFDKNLKKFSKSFDSALNDMVNAGNAYREWVEYVREKEASIPVLKKQIKCAASDVKSLESMVSDLEHDITVLDTDDGRKILEDSNACVSSSDYEMLETVLRYHLGNARKDLDSKKGEIRGLGLKLAFNENTVREDLKAISEVAPLVYAAAKKFNYARMVIAEAGKGGHARLSLLNALESANLLEADAGRIVECMAETEAIEDSYDYDNEENSKLDEAKFDYIDIMREIERLNRR